MIKNNLQKAPALHAGQVYAQRATAGERVYAPAHR
jgi:hypothetical protein